MRDRSAGSVGALVLACAVALAAVPTAAFGGGATPATLTVEEAGAQDTVTFTGRITAPAELPADPVLTFRFGQFSGSVSDLVSSSSSLKFDAAPGSSGIVRFSMSRKSGRFTLSVRGVELGTLDGPAALTFDLGGQRFTSMLPMTGKGSVRRWRLGQPILGTVTGHVYAVRSLAAQGVAAPCGGLTFVRAAKQSRDLTVVSPIATSYKTGPAGDFVVTIQYRDPAALGSLDIGRILGEEPAYTRPSIVASAQQDDGVLDVVVFVQPRDGVGAVVSPDVPADLDVAGGDYGPSGTLVVPQGAVATTLNNLSFTPYSRGTQLPARLPDGYVAIAGAEIVAGREVARAPRFKAGHLPKVELSRPGWVSRATVAAADIRLLQFRRGRWIVRPGRGRYDAAHDRIVPDGSDPAGVSEASPVVWAARRQQSKHIRGLTMDRMGNPLPGVAVFSRIGASVSGADGSFDIAPSALGDDDLEVVQAVAGTGTTARVVASGAATRGDLGIRIDAVDPSGSKLGVVSGTVFAPGGTPAVAGATVTVGIASGARGLSYDDGGTAGNFTDDKFIASGLTGLGVTTFEWSLLLPGDTAEFVSVLYTGSELVPLQLLLEAQDGGRTIVAGGYTVTARYTIPGGQERELVGGFRVAFNGVAPTVSDIQLPTDYEGATSVSATTDSTGQYSALLYAPLATPMAAVADDAASGKTGATGFLFATTVTADVTLVGDIVPPGPGEPGWTTKASLPTARSTMFCAALNGKIHVVGGLISSGTEAVHEVYDPATNSWSTRAAMPTSRYGAGVVALGGKLYVLGGVSGATGLTGIVEVWDPATDTWSSRASLPSPRPYAAFAAADGKIFACGGGDNVDLATVDAYDPVADSWSSRAPMPSGRAAGAIQELGGKIYVIGGTDPTGYRAEVYAYTPTTNQWTTVAPLADVRTAFAAGAMGGRIYIAGGSTGGYLTSLEVYDPMTNQWTGGPAMTAARSNVPGAAVGGAFYVIGGFALGGPALSIVEAYVP